MTTNKRKNNKHKKCIKFRPLNMKWALETVDKKRHFVDPIFWMSLLFQVLNKES